MTRISLAAQGLTGHSNPSIVGRHESVVRESIKKHNISVELVIIYTPAASF
jgi:hypothetical protein